jgi:Tol biopolymer transport system component
MTIKRKNLLFTLLILLSCSVNGGCSSSSNDDNGGKSENTLPTIKGKLIYHNYSSYDAGDSQIWLFDFSSKTLSNISKNWTVVTNAMNAHFSPDGKQIVFMGIGKATGTWDVFLYDLIKGGEPTNLTSTGSTRDEDPQYAPDGTRIIFKQNGCLTEMNLTTHATTTLTNAEYSMPAYNSDGTKIVCSKGGDNTSSIVIVDIKTKAISALYDEPGVQDYFPVNVDASSFYYSRGYNTSNRVDQVYRGYWSGLRSERLKFNNTDGDYSDASPINDSWLVLSSDRPGTKGQYDLYIASTKDSSIFSLSEYNSNINTAKNELGASVYVEK